MIDFIIFIQLTACTTICKNKKNIEIMFKQITHKKSYWKNLINKNKIKKNSKSRFQDFDFSRFFEQFSRIKNFKCWAFSSVHLNMELLVCLIVMIHGGLSCGFLSTSFVEENFWWFRLEDDLIGKVMGSNPQQFTHPIFNALAIFFLIFSITKKKNRPQFKSTRIFKNY